LKYYYYIITIAPLSPQEISVTRYKTQPPWEFLLSASRATLQSYELTRLSHAANLRKEIAVLLDQWLDENSSAILARWLIENRDRCATRADADLSASRPASGTATASDNFFGDPAFPSPVPSVAS
jgi:hypothetical protein